MPFFKPLHLFSFFFLSALSSFPIGEPDKGEDELLMRALRDFNTPKIPAQDTPIFLRLISDLFMGLDAQLKVNESLKKIVQIVTKEEKLQLDDSFILKVLQFQELLDVRHSVMLLGPSGILYLYNLYVCRSIFYSYFIN